MLSPSANVVITTFNRLDLTQQCLESLLSYEQTPFVITVVDNASHDGTREYLESLYSKGAIQRLFLMKRNMGVAVASNLGWACDDSDYYVKLDNDIIIQNGAWLHNLIDILESNKSVGAAAYPLCDWHVTESITLDSGHPFLKFDGLGGGCVAIPQRTHQIFGYWNEDYGVYGFEDLDYGVRLQHQQVLSGYCSMVDMVAHLGDDAYEDESFEVRKKAQTTNRASGESLYLLNKFLFENGIRPMFVDRKYSAANRNDEYVCNMNESYRAIVKLQNTLKQHFSYTVENDQVTIDLAKLSKGLSEVS